MKVAQRAVDQIHPYESNPRHNELAIDAVARSIEEYGWRQPIVIDPEGIIVAGDTRYRAALKLGLKKVPVHVAVDLTPEQAKAYRLADNRVGEIATWDQELLSLEINALDDLGVDLQLLGFTDEELAELLHPESAGLTDDDAVPDEPQEPTAVRGQVYVLGNHRLMCGDATSAEDVATLLGAVKPHLMVTDPPWGIEYDADWRNHRTLGESNRAVGAVDNDDVADWRAAWALFPGDVAYVWHAGQMANVVGDSLVAVGLDIRAQLIWVKSNIVVGRGDYHSRHEPCWYAVRKGRPGRYHGGRKQSTVWHIDKPMKSETGHSTQKPVECMKRPIENNSSPGQAVYEPFSGSGTTIIAGEKTGRHVYAMEINPIYVDVAVQRWEQWTGKQAVRE